MQIGSSVRTTQRRTPSHRRAGLGQTRLATTSPDARGPWFSSAVSAMAPCRLGLQPMRDAATDVDRLIDDFGQARSASDGQVVYLIAYGVQISRSRAKIAFAQIFIDERQELVAETF